MLLDIVVLLDQFLGLFGRLLALLKKMPYLFLAVKQGLVIIVGLLRLFHKGKPRMGKSRLRQIAYPGAALHGHCPLVGLDEPCHDAHECGLAASVGSRYGSPGLVAYIKVHILQDIPVAEGKGYSVQCNECHQGLTSLTGWKTRILVSYGSRVTISPLKESSGT